MSDSQLLLDGGNNSQPELARSIKLRRLCLVITGVSCLAVFIFLSVTVFFVPVPNMPTVDKVDVQKYVGKWYEIATNFERQEKDCFCTTAEYTILGDNDIKVTNRCRKFSTTGQLTEANGKAWAIDNTNSKLKVSFFWPFAAYYFIVDLDPDYQWAVIVSPKSGSFWILSRTPKLASQTIYDNAVKKLHDLGVDTSGKRDVDQTCSA
eukprot:TRINITY_DN12437_c0_g1_i1.p1 TRINITY_DN12437_c0_g1~~TRINITY_DN12437_c0_g1_i1.p1  ORF type:complete len:207 (-),score=65.05 TRINITY_DN12437_c0_g1_i1:95-715(-)